MNGKYIHPVLVNKKSGKVASSHSWLLALAAVAHLKGNTSGILGLLPLMQAEKLLHKNEVTFKTVRGHKGDNLRRRTRSQAKSFLPNAIIEFERKRRVFKLFTKKDLSAWIVQALSDPYSYLYKKAQNMGYDEILELQRSPRWWQDQLKKLQS